MKSQSFKIAVIMLSSVAVLVGTFIAAGIIADKNRKGFSYDFPQTQYTKTQTEVSSAISSKPAESIPQTSTHDTSEVSSEEEQGSVDIAIGSYFSGNDRILIISADNGFVEGEVLSKGITMSFSGQAVDNVLTITGVDDRNNTIELILTFQNNEISASSRPLIQYEETEEFLTVSGVFKK